MKKMVQIILLAAAILTTISLIITYNRHTPLQEHQQPPTALPVIIDTDLSLDDFVAILYLFQRKNVDILAITVVNGVTHVTPGVENLQRLLFATNRQTIPIAGGRQTPLVGTNSFPQAWRLPIEQSMRAILPNIPTPPVPMAAEDLIIEAVHRSKSPPTFLALGPLTNLALALQKDPSLIHKIKTVVVCGGAISVIGTMHEEDPSQVNTVSEWNFFVDPYAAHIVFSSGIPIQLVPLDVTHIHGPRPVLFSTKLIHRFSTLAKTPSTQLMAKIMELWLTHYPQHGGSVPIWDLVAAIIAIEPNIAVDWKKVPIKIIQNPQWVAGQTVIGDTYDQKVEVCFAGDGKLFEKALLEIL